MGQITAYNIHHSFGTEVEMALKRSKQPWAESIKNVSSASSKELGAE